MPRMMRASVSDTGTSFPEAGRKSSTASPSGLRPAAAKPYACAVRAMARSAESGNGSADRPIRPTRWPDRGDPR